MACSAKTSQQPLENIVSLEKILSNFDGPLNEEQAWAVCYQCAQFLRLSSFWEDGDRRRSYYNLDGLEEVGIHRDGSVTVLESGSPRETADDDRAELSETTHTESTMVNALGRIVYHALDYGCQEEEERLLSEPLEDLIERMTGCGGENDDTDGNNEEDEDGRSQCSQATDEGIVDGHESDDLDENANGKDTNDKGTRRLSSFSGVLQLCVSHLLKPDEASSHYQAVCRALVAEVQELKSFLKVIATSKKNLQILHVNDESRRDPEGGFLNDLQPKQWARIWMQVLQQLRRGVQLKEVGEARQRISIEYEMTPYEILMDDVRSRKYTLKKVLVNGDIPPRVKKEAHDVILDFIRSRPPLRPVPKSYEMPLRKISMYEMLMNEIRSGPLLTPASQRIIKECKAKSKIKKRSSRLKSLPKLRHQSTSEGSCTSSIDSEDLEFFETSPELPRKVLRAEITLDWSDEDDAQDSSRSENCPTDTNQLTVKTDTLSPSTFMTSPSRRDVIPLRRLATINAPSFDTMLSQDSSVTPTNDDPTSDLEDDLGDETEPLLKQESPRRHSIAVCQTSQSDPDQPEPYQPPPCLALTVDEVIHIRSVLVKAEMENLRVNLKVYESVIREKICFSCKKKFALFKRKSRCKLCKRLICSICCKKMFLPRGQFLQIPIESLSPISPKKSPTFTAFYRKSHSEPPTPSVSPQGSPRLWRREKRSPFPKDRLDDVCCQCKDFLREAVRSSIEASRLRGRGHERGLEITLDSPPRQMRLAKQDSRDSQGSGDSGRSRRTSLRRRSSNGVRSNEYRRLSELT